MKPSTTNASTAGLDEPYYCHQQINIPPELPDIMKQFTKAAIRYQPKDVLAWSAEYFKAMARGEMPPVVERVALPVATQKTDTGLTINILKMLNYQLGPKRVVTLQLIDEKWRAAQLPAELFHEICNIGGFYGEVEWNYFLAIAASSLAGVKQMEKKYKERDYNHQDGLPEALRTCCEVLTHDPEGGPERIPLPLFKTLYEFLARIDGTITDDTIKFLEAYMEEQAGKQDGFVQPRNFLSEHCPRLTSKVA